MKLEYVEGFSYDPAVDAGKVLKVKEDGTGLEWAEGSGGGEDGSGGGGGGSSAFEEQYGVAGWHTVEITFQAPEGAEDSLEEASVAVTILIVGALDHYILKIINPVELDTMLISENKYVLHVPYLAGDDSTSYFNITGVAGQNFYVTDGSRATCTGDVEYDSYVQAIKVTGDGAVTASLDFSD